MSQRSSQEVPFPICKNVFCKKNLASDRIFWKKETEQQYQFYLATLRANRDSEYLKQEYINIINQAQSAESENRELRMKIRLLEIELFLMLQRNAHDSYVIDGLQEVDFEKEEVDRWEAWIRHLIAMVTSEREDEDQLTSMLKKEISLLIRKSEEDSELIRSFRPLEEKLKNMLEEEKMNKHQQAMKFKRGFEDILKNMELVITRLQQIRNERSPEMLWVNEEFSKIFERKKPDDQDLPDSYESSTGSTVETKQFIVSSEASGNVAAEEDETRPLTLKQECSEFIGKKELLDAKNVVNLHLLYDNYISLADSMELLAREYSHVYEVIADIAFLKEYHQRLDAHRKKKDTADEGKISPEEAQKLDQMGLILSTLLREKELMDSTLSHFLANLKEDFEAHCVTLRNLEVMYEKSFEK